MSKATADRIVMLYQRFEASVESFLQGQKKFERFFIALSGGLDSSVLLDLFSRFVKNNNLQNPVIVLHVNHAIHSEASGWEAFCKARSQHYGFPFESTVLAGLMEGERQLPNLEQAARQARYRFFEARANTNDLLLLGHHQDDQAETVLFNLIKGHGVSALAGMPESRNLNRLSSNSALLFRPLLGFSREALQDYAMARQLQWREDPSNSDEKYSRNFIRHQILPVIKQQWPAALDTISRSSFLLAENHLLLEELAREDYAACIGSDPWLTRWAENLDLHCVKQLSERRVANLLRHWLSEKGVLMPSYKLLKQLIDEISRMDAGSKTLVSWKQENLQVHFYAFEKHLFLVIEDSVASDAQDATRLEKKWHLNDTANLAFANLFFSVSLQETDFQKAPFVNTPFVKSTLLKHAIDVLDVQVRRGGERCKPLGRMHSQSLKKLFLEYRVPFWLRDRLPLFYFQGALVAVSDLWVCDGFESQAGEKAWQITCL